MENQTVDATHCDPDLIVFGSGDCNNHPCGAGKHIKYNNEHFIC